MVMYDRKAKLEKHGLRDHKLYGIWGYIKSSCYNTNSTAYDIIGARGIKVCNEWSKSFKAFHDWALQNGWHYNYMMKRKDLKKDYTPENCYFYPRSETIKEEKKSSVRGVC
jgi:hypothetical protein